MAYQGKNLIFAAAGGFLAAILVISAIMSAGMVPGIETPWSGLTTTTGTTGTMETKGLLIIKVMDAPASLDELFLDIDEVKVHRAGGGEETWSTIGLVKTEPFDLLTLKTTELALVLAVEELEVGNYTEIRLHIEDAWATIDGEEDQPLRIVNDWLMVKIRFEIEEEPKTIVIIDIDVNEEPVLNAGILQPVVKAKVEYL